MQVTGGNAQVTADGATKAQTIGVPQDHVGSTQQVHDGEVVAGIVQRHPIAGQAPAAAALRTKTRRPADQQGCTNRLSDKASCRQVQVASQTGRPEEIEDVDVVKHHVAAAQYLQATNEIIAVVQCDVVANTRRQHRGTGNCQIARVGKGAGSRDRQVTRQGGGAQHQGVAIHQTQVDGGGTHRAAEVILGRIKGHILAGGQNGSGAGNGKNAAIRNTAGCAEAQVAGNGDRTEIQPVDVVERDILSAQDIHRPAEVIRVSKGNIRSAASCNRGRASNRKGSDVFHLGRRGDGQIATDSRCINAYLIRVQGNVTCCQSHAREDVVASSIQNYIISRGAYGRLSKDRRLRRLRDIAMSRNSEIPQDVKLAEDHRIGRIELHIPGKGNAHVANKIIHVVQCNVVACPHRQVSPSTHIHVAHIRHRTRCGKREIAADCGCAKNKTVDVVQGDIAATDNAGDPAKVVGVIQHDIVADTGPDGGHTNDRYRVRVRHAASSAQGEVSPHARSPQAQAGTCVQTQVPRHRTGEHQGVDVA